MTDSRWIMPPGVDIRDVYPELLNVMGVNTANEHDIIHGVLILLVRKFGLTVEDVQEMIDDLVRIKTQNERDD